MSTSIAGFWHCHPNGRGLQAARPLQQFRLALDDPVTGDQLDVAGLVMAVLQEHNRGAKGLSGLLPAHPRLYYIRV